ncbi:MAG: F0F1 ATP synthase subunit A [Chitinophagaceae bacterium]
MRLFRILTLLVLSFLLTSSASFAQDNSAEVINMVHQDEKEKKLDVAGVMFSHVGDSHEWHLFGFRGHPISIPLPVIVYTKTGGIQIFSSSHFNYHEMEEHTLSDEKTHISNSYNGFHLEQNLKEKLIADNGDKVYDFSLTKNVIAMLLGILLLLWIILSVAKKYQVHGHTKAPSGFQNAFEPIVTFMRDEVAKPNLGYQYKRFMPLILTLFFFIWINNLLGILPFGFNFTGNIAVTLCLSVVAFIVMLWNANKHFWSHLLNPPGIHWSIKWLLVFIEILSLFVKPVALTIRLFANILAGHIVILSVIFMIFIFGTLNKGVGIGFIPVSLAFSVFMFMLELMVGAIQAFIFANLTAVFIGQAIEETSHHHDEAHHSDDHNEITGQQYHVSEMEVIA